MLINVEISIFCILIRISLKNKVLETVRLYLRIILVDELSLIALRPCTRGLRWTRERVKGGV